MSSSKQKALKQKRRLKRLRKKERRQSILPPNALTIHDLPGMAKMSKVLQAFVQPYMDSVTSEEDLRKLLTIGCVAWNAAMLAPAEREETIRQTEETLPAEARDDFRTVLEPMIARKQQHFAANRRGILNFTLTMEPTGPYLQVMSTLEA